VNIKSFSSSSFKYWLPWLAAVFSGLLLSAAFPPLGVADVVWVALIPLMLACQHSRRPSPLALGFVTGVVFWSFSIYWIAHVTVAGYVALVLYCSLYFAAFGYAFAWLSRKKEGVWWSNLAVMTASALLWSGLEWLRANLLTGYSWNQLSISQYQNIVMIQSAEWGGVYALSGLIVLFNTAAFLTISRYVVRGGKWGRRLHFEMLMAIILIALAFAFGVERVREYSQPSQREISLALVQPNIEQCWKWDDAYVDNIYVKLRSLTRTASLHADLTVWPETAIPGFLRDEGRSSQLVYELTRNGENLLVGGMDFYNIKPNVFNYYNSSFLMRKGMILAKYDKQHLVLFGEYVPFEKLLPFLDAFTPIDGTFQPGEDAVIMNIGDGNIPVSPLICFEDAFSPLATKAVRKGARLLINQTNDSWFDPSCGSRQHLSQSVFRCVENRVPMARCANTGMTCWIDETGRVREILKDQNNNVRCPGFLLANIPVPPDNMEMTQHSTSHGLFGKICATATILILISARLFQTRRKSPREQIHRGQMK